jgi:hypothetical protein
MEGSILNFQKEGVREIRIGKKTRKKKKKKKSQVKGQPLKLRNLMKNCSPSNG